MKIKFSELSRLFFSISELFATRQEIVGKTSFTMEQPRHTDAFLLFTGCTGICYQEGEMPFYISQGSLVYMPKDSRYMWETSPLSENESGERLLFEFMLNEVETKRSNDEKHAFSVCCGTEGERIYFSDKVEIVSTDHKELYRKQFSDLISAFSKQDTAPLDVYIAAYEIFKTVSDDKSRKPFADARIISKGIKYMEENPIPDKSIAEISAMCGVSIGCFERLFKSHYGITPMEFLNEQKIFFIKELLRDKNNSLEEIAEKTGYCDSGYLCRIFKKKTGMTPGEYRKLYFSNMLLNKDPKLIQKTWGVNSNDN